MPSGSAPYEEGRLSTRSRLLAALSGLSAIRPGAGFGESFLQGLGGSARNVFLAQNQAQQAAQDYAQRQIEQEAAREDREIRKGFLAAQTKASEKPIPPPKPEPKTIDTMTPEEWKQHITRQGELARAKAAGRPQGGAVGKAATAAPKPAKPPTAGERRSAGALMRASGLDTTATDLEKGFTGMGAQLRLKAPYWAQTQEGKKYTQSRQAFTETVLREFSGAAISKDEYDKYDRIFFAQPGDNEGTLKQKQKTRAGILSQLRSMGGAAAAEMTRAQFDAMMEQISGVKAGGSPSGFDPEAAARKYGLE